MSLLTALMATGCTAIARRRLWAATGAYERRLSHLEEALRERG